MSREWRTASLPGAWPGHTIETRLEVYVCDHCGAISPDATWWVQAARMGIMGSWSDPLSVDRHFCSMAHAGAWLVEHDDKARQ
jgi:hypothetical protein